MTSLIKLSADNFTSLWRTPWAGDSLSKNLKKNHVLAGTKIGECWEVSCSPEKPSWVEDMDTPTQLSTLFEKDGYKLFGTTECELLIKIIDTANNLSIQLHPDDDYQNLKSDECGKHECWYIMDHQPGSGVYVGFKEGVAPEKISQILQNPSGHADIVKYLNFVKVRRGDFFDIKPKVVHAIGAGITLLECQRTQTKKKAVTYRLWDWDRKYSNEGSLDNVNGMARPLHASDCLKIVEPAKQSGKSFLKNCQPAPLYTKNICSFPKSDYCQLHVLQLTPNKLTKIKIEGNYVIIIPLEHSVHLGHENEMFSLELGHSYLTTNTLKALAFSNGMNSKVAIVCPQGTQIHTL